MPISDINSRQAVLDAIAEFDRIGREAFLEKYGFGASREYWLVHNGNRYDSKAVVGAARGYARPDLGPMNASEFTGGQASVQRKLEALGFSVVVDGDAPISSTQTSERLTPGAVYTRAELKALFGITDATINTGVFRPKGTSSVWLFVTENKTADRTPYRDRLEGDTLRWQGQSKGRTDDLVVNHRTHGLELLVFFRESKNEHPGAGFRYLGPFEYVSHSGARPTSFVLRLERADPLVAPGAGDDATFDPANIEDARRRISRTITQRRGQKAFRDALVAAYNGRCAFSDCSVMDVLEAAHIHPYRGPDTNKVVNGLLLRSDLHTLFDCGLLAVDTATMTVMVAPQIRESEYGSLHGRGMRQPADPTCRPSAEALDWHRDQSVLREERTAPRDLPRSGDGSAVGVA